MVDSLATSCSREEQQLLSELTCCAAHVVSSQQLSFEIPASPCFSNTLIEAVYIHNQDFAQLTVTRWRKWWWLVSLSVLQKKKLPYLSKHLELMKVHILTIFFFFFYNFLLTQFYCFVHIINLSSEKGHIYMDNLYIYLINSFLSRYGLCQCWLLGKIPVIDLLLSTMI